jgi:hypothetical protein
MKLESPGITLDYEEINTDYIIHNRERTEKENVFPLGERGGKQPGRGLRGKEKGQITPVHNANFEGYPSG